MNAKILERAIKSNKRVKSMIFHFSTSNFNNSIYKRALPQNCIELNSVRGKALLQESLAQGTAQSFFNLISHFKCQSEVNSCGLATLTMALNSLSIDPQKQWKGWISEKNINCCPEDYQNGSGLEAFAHLALRNGLAVQVFTPLCTDFTLSAMKCPSGHDSQTLISASLSNFVDCVVAACRMEGLVFAANFSRKYFQQSGDGHYSLVGAINEGKSKALILDVARFKYPPYWVGIEELYESMKLEDAETRKPRGFLLLARDSLVYPRICRISEDYMSQTTLRLFFENNQISIQNRSFNEFLNFNQIYSIFELFPKSIRNCLVSYLFELSNRLERGIHCGRSYNIDGDVGNGRERLRTLIFQLNELIRNSIGKSISSENENNGEFKSLINSFQPSLLYSISMLFYFSLPLKFRKENNLDLQIGLQSESGRRIQEFIENEDIFNLEISEIRLNLGISK